MEDPYNPSRYGLLHFGLDDDCNKPEEAIGNDGIFRSPFYEVNLGTPYPPVQGDNVTAIFTSVLNQNGIYQLHVNDCPAYYQRYTSGEGQQYARVTSRWALSDGTRVLVACRLPSPSAPPPPPPPDAYETGKCAFFSRSYSDFSERTEFEDDTGLSTAGYNGPQPTIVVPPSVDNPTFLSEAKATTGDARRKAVNGHPALYYNVASSTVTDEATAYLNSSMTNARCIELCKAWRVDDALQGCRSYEYTMHDGAKSDEHGSAGPTEGENKLMRCKMWVYPRNPDHYTYVAPMDGATICEAASGLPIEDRENSAVVVTQPWPPNAELEFQEMYSGFAERYPDHELLNGLGMADLYGHDVALSFDGRVLAMRASEYVYWTSYAEVSQYEGEKSDDQGYLRVVEWNGADWVQRGQTFHGPHRTADLGFSLALDDDGDTLAFAVPGEYTGTGNYYDDGPGNVYSDEGRGGTVRVYDYDAALQDWVQRGQHLTTESLFGTGTLAAFRGACVALNNVGDHLLLGVPQFNQDQEDANWARGVVIMFQYDAAQDRWVETGQRIFGEPPPAGYTGGYNFGHSVSMSQDASRIVVSDANFNAGAHEEAGLVRVYDYDPASSQWIQNGADIVGASAWAGIGKEVSMAYSGNSVAISSTGLGRVFVYDYNATATDSATKWVERGAGQLVGPAGTGYGQSVAISADGTRVVVGQTHWVNPHIPEALSNADHGRARIYSWSWSTNTWIEFHDTRLHGTEGFGVHGYACSISRDGDVVAVSMPRWNDPDGPGPSWVHTGKVFVYEAVPIRTTPAPPPWPPSPPLLLSSPPPPHVDFRSLYSDYEPIGTEMRGLSQADFAGASVALSRDGTTLVFGAPRSNDFMTYDDLLDNWGPGYSEVYEFNADTQSWDRIGSRLEGDTDTQRHGHAVAINTDGTRIAIGSAANYRFLGHVAVWAWDASSDDWARLGDDVVLDDQVAGSTYPGASDPTCGISVAMSDDGSLVAAGCVSHAGTGGAVQVFRWDEEGMAWQEHGQRLAEAHNGHMVALSGDGQVLAIGSPLNEVNGLNDAGDARVYAWEDGAWASRGDPLDGEAAQGMFGKSLALSADGGILAVGAPGYVQYRGCEDATDDTSCKGSVRVYAWEGGEWAPMGDAIVGPNAASHLGESVALSATGDVLAIGSHGVDAGPSGTANDPRTREDEGHLEGRVYAWNAVNSAWSLIGDGIDGGTDQGMNDVSSSVALSANGTRLAMGAWPFKGYQDFPELSEGVVRVYDAVED
jgi:hypothetical protein